MKHFLLVFDRRRSRLLSLNEYQDADQRLALEDRLSYDRAVRYPSDLEVVVLSAESRDDLERTHSSYFKNFRELEFNTHA